MFISGNYAYIADGANGLLIIDISNPGNPTFVGNYGEIAFACDLYVSGNYAYVAADQASGLQIIDITSPESPNFVGWYDTPGYAKDVYVFETHAYVADLNAGLQILDIANPETPIFVRSYNIEGNANGVYVSGKYAYVAADDSGLQIIQHTGARVVTAVGGSDPNIDTIWDGVLEYRWDFENDGVWDTGFLELDSQNFPDKGTEIVCEIKDRFNATSRAEIIIPLYGDVNLDKVVNILDITALERLIAEVDPITPLKQKAGDVSGDGTLSALDINLIMQYIVQLIDKFPVEGGQLPAGSADGIATTDIEAEVGQSIEIPLKAVEFEDALGMDMDIQYDNNVLEFKGIDGVGIGLSTEVKWYEENPGDVKVIVQTPVGGGISGTGDVAVIRFDVKQQIGPTKTQVEIKNIDAHEIVLEDIFSTGEISLSRPKARSWIWPPRKARKRQRVFFWGYGYDLGGGRIVEYSWRSSRDGKLSDSRFFVTNRLSVGRHTIYFKVKNDKGVWSKEFRRGIRIQPPRRRPYPFLKNIDKSQSLDTVK